MRYLTSFPTAANVKIDRLAYLDALQNTDGGLPYAAGGDPTSDANSTAYVVQALVTAGEDSRAPGHSAGGLAIFLLFMALRQTYPRPTAEMERDGRRENGANEKHLPPWQSVDVIYSRFCFARYADQGTMQCLHRIDTTPFAFDEDHRRMNTDRLVEFTQDLVRLPSLSG